MTLAQIRQPEQITWVSAEHLPDVDETVLVTLLGDDEPVWLGFFDGTDWVDATTGGAFMGNVTAWAAMPRGFSPAAIHASHIEQLEAIGQQRLPIEELCQEHAL